MPTAPSPALASRAALARLDAAAVSLSGLCVLHCLALPLAASALPALGLVAEAEWLHRAFVVLAVATTGWAIVDCTGRRGRRGRKVARRAARKALLVGAAVLGLALLVAGAFVEALRDHETALTVAGAGVLAGAHLARWGLHLRARG